MTSKRNGASTKRRGHDAPEDDRTRLTTLLTLLALPVLLAGCAPAPAMRASAQPYAGLEQRPIKGLAPERVADLLAGRGASYALAAELNWYPGPRHVLDLAAGLALTPEQQRAAEEAYAAMEAEAKRLGQQLVEREAALDQAFAGGAATADEVGQLAGAAAAMEGQLRAVHLRAHLAMKAILTPEQVARYDRLRGYAGDTAPSGGGHGTGGHRSAGAGPRCRPLHGKPSDVVLEKTRQSAGLGASEREARARWQWGGCVGRCGQGYAWPGPPARR